MDKRIRSPNYPALGLPEAVEKAAAIYRNLHTHASSREVVAKAMGYTGLNGASASAVSALHKYGLLEGRGDEIRVSERAMRIMHPESPAERVEALREAAFSPPLFAELNGRFPGKTPNDDLLRNFLLRNGFAQAALPAVTSAYRDTLEMVEREEDGYGSGTPQPAEAPSPKSHLQRATSPFSPSLPLTSEVSANERPIGRYDFEGGGYVRIAAAGDHETEELLDMVETLIQLKRAELRRKNNRSDVESRALTVIQKDEEEGQK